jgi:hypothetical protein
MKSADFFIEKANEYIKSIEEILPNIFSKYSQGLDPTPEYIEQSEKISDLKFKTKLLFTEFDNGELFINKITDIDDARVRYGEDPLEKYKHILSLFVEHIKDFRK